jgi:hypothetical protein
MILKIFWQKMAVFAQTSASFWNKKLTITLVFEKTPFFAENWQKTQKTVIITSTLGVSIWETPNRIPAMFLLQAKSDFHDRVTRWVLEKLTQNVAQPIFVQN